MDQSHGTVALSKRCALLTLCSDIGASRDVQQAAQKAAESNASDSPAEQDTQLAARKSASAGDETSSESSSLQEWETVARPQVLVSLKSSMQAVPVQQGMCLSSVSASVLRLAC